jgi:hypothetical protein
MGADCVCVCVLSSLCLGFLGLNMFFKLAKMISMHKLGVEVKRRLNHYVFSSATLRLRSEAAPQ